MSFKQRAQTLSHNWRKQKVKDLSRTEMSCSRCGRSGHSIGSCFAKSSVHGRDLMSEKQVPCFRCGRNGHASSACFARSTVDGRPLLPPSTSRHFQGPHITPGQRGRSGVYVLQYANGMFYVGKSSNIDRRIGEHASGMVACTAEWGVPTEVPTVTPPLDTDHESWERNETLELMKLNGISKVRGWMYTSQDLTEDAEESIVSQLCEKYDCCRLCGSSGHFISACPKQNRTRSSSSGEYGSTSPGSSVHSSFDADSDYDD